MLHFPGDGANAPGCAAVPEYLFQAALEKFRRDHVFFAGTESYFHRGRGDGVCHNPPDLFGAVERLDRADDLPVPVPVNNDAAGRNIHLARRRAGLGASVRSTAASMRGRYSPMWIYGKKISRNGHAYTREECKEKLKALIAEMQAELAELKELMVKGKLRIQDAGSKKGKKLKATIHTVISLAALII